MVELKNRIHALLLSTTTNEGTKTHVIKFLETFVLTFTRPDPGQTNPRAIFDLPATADAVVPRAQLAEEGESIVQQLVTLLTHQALSPSNLGVVVSSLALLGRTRSALATRWVLDGLLQFAASLVSGSGEQQFGPAQLSSLTHATRTALLQFLRCRFLEGTPFPERIADALVALGAREQVDQLRRLPDSILPKRPLPVESPAPASASPASAPAEPPAKRPRTEESPADGVAAMQAQAGGGGHEFPSFAEFLGVPGEVLADQVMALLVLANVNTTMPIPQTGALQTLLARISALPSLPPLPPTSPSYKPPPLIQPAPTYHDARRDPRMPAPLAPAPSLPVHAPESLQPSYAAPPPFQPTSPPAQPFAPPAQPVPPPQPPSAFAQALPGPAPYSGAPLPPFAPGPTTTTIPVPPVPPVPDGALHAYTGPSGTPALGPVAAAGGAGGGLVRVRLSEEARTALERDLYERVLGAEGAAQRAGRAQARLQLLARLAAQRPRDHPAHARLLDHVAQAVASRSELALHWLTQEWLRGEPQRYEAQLSALLQRLPPLLSPSDKDSRRLFAHFFLDLPHLPDLAFRFLEVPPPSSPPSLPAALFSLYLSCVTQSCCEDAERAPLGLEALRKLVLGRPAARTRCLRLLLNYAVSKGKMDLHM